MKLPFQLDRYTLVHRIGVGAFGQVYRAEVRGDMGFVSDFAVKVLDSNVVADNPNVARQLGDEARILSQLDHPNIVKVVDFKHIEHHVLGNVYFMVMECVRGTDVATILRRVRPQDRAIPATAVLHMGLMISDALAHAHTLQSRDGTQLCIVHRDLKPQNLMVNFRGQVKVLDFGIAKATADDRLAARTQEGQTKGTVFYMSPEQLSGDPLDGRSDIYSLGTILYELLLGTRLLDVEVSTAAELVRAMHTAFEMDIEERLTLLKAHLHEGANGDLSNEAIEGWLGLLRASLQKDRNYRQDSAAAFSQQLEKLRALHPPAENRDFWAHEVESAAADQQVTYDSEHLAGARPAEALPDDAIAGGSGTHEFFGMETGALADDEPAAARPPPETVPLTRGMAVVTGTVRSFGSDIVQRLGPVSQTQAVITKPKKPLEEVTEPYSPGKDPQTMDMPAHDGTDSNVDTVGDSKPADYDPSDADTSPAMAPLAEDEISDFEETVTDTSVVTRSGTHKTGRRRRTGAAGSPQDAASSARLGGILAAALLIAGGVALVSWFTRSAPEEIVEESAVAIATNSSEIQIEAEAEPVGDGEQLLTENEKPMATGTPPAEAVDAPSPTAATEASHDNGSSEARAKAKDTAEDSSSSRKRREEREREQARKSKLELEQQQKAASADAPVPRERPAVVSTATAVDAKAKSEPKTSEPKVEQGTADKGFVRVIAKPRCRVEAFTCPCSWPKTNAPKTGGHRLGTTDETRKGIWLPVGEHRIRFICDDPEECVEGWEHKTGVKTVTIKPGKDNKRVFVDMYLANGVSR